MKTRVKIGHLIALAAALACAAAAAGGASFPLANGREPEDKAPAADRVDLAFAVLRFEEVYASAPPAVERLPEINRAFDAATISFFTGDFAGAVEQLNAVTFALDREAPPAPGEALAAALQVRIVPPAYTIGSGTAASARIRPLYTVEDSPAAPGDAVELVLRIRSGSGAPVWEAAFAMRRDSAAADGLTLPLPLDEINPRAGTFIVEIAPAGGRAFRVAHWPVLDRSLDAVKTENERRLAAVPAETPRMIQAAAACAARNGLLDSGFMHGDDLTLVLSDPCELAGEIDREIAALLDNRDPYERRTGDIWYAVRAGDELVPLRVYAPAAAAAADGDSMPLVVALHGAGGSEHLFMDGYGAGAIKAMAERRGFIAAAPRVSPLGMKPAAFDAIVETLCRRYNVDARRIYVVGHSAGSFAAASLSLFRGDRIAAVCCFSAAALPLSAGQEISPLLLITGTIDPLAPAARAKDTAERAREAGLPVELRLAENYGHYLLVGDMLDEAAAWLLQHRSKREF